MILASTHPVRKALISFVLILLGVNAFGQFDTRFWMPPIWDANVSSLDQPSELFITTPYPEPVNVYIRTSDFSTFVLDTVVSSGNPLQIPLTPVLGQTMAANSIITDAGFVIKSDAPIQAVHKVAGSLNQTLVTLKGSNGRGTDFWAGSQVRNEGSNYFPDEYHFISVMALEDNTSITFETPFVMYELDGDLPNPHTITLDKYDCYLIRSKNSYDHVAGAHITSDKDIVAISGSTHTRIENGNAADGGTDQLVPIELAGYEFVFVKGQNDDPFDYSIIVATEDNTEVFLDGGNASIATIDAGEFYDYTLTGTMGAAHYIQTSKPSYCYHVTGASYDDEVGMSAIPQIECTGSRYVEFSKFETNTTNQIMNVIFPPDAEESMMINGQHYSDVPDIIFNTVPGKPGWGALSIPESSLLDDNILESEGFFHAGFLTGNPSSTGTYGFLSGFDDAFEFLNPANFLPTTIYTWGQLCQGENIDHCLEVYSCADDHNITAFEGNEGEVVVTPFSMPFDSCFSYTAPFDFVGPDTVSFTVENRFGFEGHVDVVFLIVDPDTPIDAGPVQELCSEFTATLSAIEPDSLINGYWTVLQGGSSITNPNQSTTEVTNLALGTNTFLWTQDYGCEVNQSLTQIIVYDGTAPSASAGPDVSLCSNESTYVMQANDPQYTATGTWEITQGTATIWNINDPTALITNLGIGENKFEWNIDNGPCPGGPTFDQMSIFVYDQNHPPANAGTDQEFCSSDFTETTFIANSPIFPATGIWSVVSGSATMNDPNDPELTITSAAIGVNVLEWSINNGPCGIYTDTVTLTIYDENASVAVAGTDAEYCTPAPSHTMDAVEPSGPGFGTWSIVSGSGVFDDANDATTTVSNLGVGVNVFEWTLFNGDCSQTGSSDTVTITVYNSSQSNADAGEDQAFCLPDLVSVQLDANAILPPASGNWTVVSGSGNFDDTSNPGASVDGLMVGSNVFEWTVDNGPCGAPTSDQIEVLVYDPNQSIAFAGVDTSFCSPISSYTMMAVNPGFPSLGEWTLISGTGTISDINDPNAVIDGLTVGENVFRWTITNGPCDSAPNFDEVVITIYDPTGPAADAGEDQEFCFQGGSPVIATMDANTPAPPGTGSWTIIQGVGVIQSPSSPTTDIVGLAIGENIFEWTIDNGPCGVPTTDQIRVFVFDPTQTDADAGPDQGLCSNAANTNLSGNGVTFPATGTWTLIQGTGTIADNTDPNTAVSGLGLGENIFEWTIDNGACDPSITSDQVIITVYDQTVQPADAGEDLLICSTTSLVTLDANFPTPPALGTWNVISGIGAITDPNDPQTTVTSLGVGELVLEWTLENGACGGTTTDQVSIFIYDSNAPFADAGPDQEICTPTTSATMAGNTPIFPAIGTWELVSGAGMITDPNDPATPITGLAVGENVFRWTINNAPCTPGTTLDLVTIFVFDGSAPVADAGLDQEYCSPVSSTLLNANAAVFPAIGIWSVVSGTGTFVNPNSPNTQVNGLSLGDNIFEWTISGGPCPGTPSVDQVVITIFDASQEDADAGADQVLCSPLDNTAMDGSPVAYPASGTWTLISGVATIVDPGDPTTAITGLGIGEHVFQWSIDNGPCGTPTADEVSIFVYDSADISADAGADQELCLPANSAVLAANSPVIPAIGTWIVIQGAGVFSDINDPNATVSNLAVGENILEWTVDNGGCGLGTTSDQVSITLFSNTSPDALAGADQFLCTPDVDTFLEANSPLFPATGTWTLVSGGGTIVDPTDPNTEVTSLPIGINVFEWTISNGPCPNATTSDQVQIFVFNGGAPQPFAGDDIEICTPQTSVILDADAAIAPGNGTWTLFTGSGTIVDDTDPNTSITGLTVGTNTFVWTVDYATCGLDRDTVDVILFDSTLQPANAGPDQDFCLPTNSTNMGATAVSDPAFGTWSLIQGNGVIVDENDPNTSILNLTVGENIFVWNVYNSTCSDPTLMMDTVSIFINDDSQLDADAGPDQIICSTVPSVVMDANPPIFPATGTWTLVSGTGTISDPTDPQATITSMLPGVNVFEWTIDNGSCPGGLTTDQVSIFVFDNDHPPADAGPDQEFCTPVSSTNLAGSPVTAPTTGVWQLLIGNANIANPNDPNTLITNLGVGENIFQWTVVNGPCGVATTDVVSIFIYNEFNADADAGEDQELCTPEDATTLAAAEPIFPAIGTWSVLLGGATIDSPNNPESPVTGLTVGENQFLWALDNGPCANGITTDTVSVFLFDEGASLADAGADQEFCTPVSSTFLEGNTPDLPGTGTWTLISGSGVITDPNDPATEVTGLAIGEHIFEWTIYNGPCALSNSVDQVSIFIFDENQSAADAGPNQEICTPVVSTYLDANELTTPATGQWTLIQGSATILNAADPNTFIDDLALGSNIFVWTVDNGPCAQGLSTDTVTIDLFDLNAPVSDAGTDQEVCLPNDFAVMDANVPENAAEGTWLLVSGTGTIVDENDPATVLLDLGVGENLFAWTIDNGDCGFSTDTVSISLFDPSAAEAFAGEDKEFCTPITSTNMNGNIPDAPGMGIWSLLSGSGVIDDENDPFTLVSNLAIGENIFCWMIDNGPCGEPTSDCVSIFVYDENAPAANAGDDLEICLPVNSVVLDAEIPVNPAVGTWTILSGSGTMVAPNNPATSIIDLEVGTTTLVWTVDNGACDPDLTTDTLQVAVFQEDITSPYAGPDQNLCTPQSSTFLEADPLNDPNTGMWELIAGDGIFADQSDPNTEVTGLTQGSNVFVWSVYNGPCVNSNYSDTVIVAVFQTNLDQPDAGDDQELCLPLNNTIVQGSIPPPPADVEWELLSGAGTIVDPTSTQTSITDLEQGVNLFTYSVMNGPCMNVLLVDTIAISVYSDNAIPADAGDDITICTPESSVTMDATPPDIPGVGTWSIIQGSASISDVNDPNAIVSALTVGQTILQWAVYNGNCTNTNTFDFVTISVFDANNASANAGEDQEFCWPLSLTTLAANTPTFPASGSWSILTGEGMLNDIQDPTAELTGVGIGTHTLVWTVENGPCGPLTQDTVQVLVFDPSSPPADAGIDQEFCTPFNGMILSGSNPNPPATGIWTVISGSADILNPALPNSSVNSLGLGANTLVWTVDNGACDNAVTSDTLVLYLNDVDVSSANAGLDQFYCGEVDSLQLAGSVTIGNTAFGDWTLVNGGGTFANTANEASYVFDVPLGINTYVWTVDNGFCGVTSDTMQVVVYNPEAAAAFAGLDINVCDHEFTTFSLEANSAEPPAFGYWTILDGPIEISDEDDPEALVLDAGDINTPLESVLSTLVWTIDNGECGTSMDSLLISLDDCLTIEIPDAISPNGDGYNDYFVVPNLLEYPNNTLKIFNRWGAMVYNASPYQNDWDGTSSHGNMMNSELPVSTYYYILDLGNGTEALTGYIYLKR